MYDCLIEIGGNKLTRTIEMDADFSIANVCLGFADEAQAKYKVEVNPRIGTHEGAWGHFRAAAVFRSETWRCPAGETRGWRP